MTNKFSFYYSISEVWLIPLLPGTAIAKKLHYLFVTTSYVCQNEHVLSKMFQIFFQSTGQFASLGTAYLLHITLNDVNPGVSVVRSSSGLGKLCKELLLMADVLTT